MDNEKRVKWTEKYAVVLERVGEGRIMLELMKKGKRNWLGHLLRRNCLLKDVLEGMVNGKNVHGRRRYQMMIIINVLPKGRPFTANSSTKAAILP